MIGLMFFLIGVITAVRPLVKARGSLFKGTVPLGRQATNYHRYTQ